MAKSYEQKAVLFKVEATEGTDAAPTGGASAFRTLNYQPTFMTADGKVRNIDKAFMGANPVTLAGFRRGATFDVEMSGSGVGATTIPAWMILNRMAGFGTGTVGGSSVVQTGAAVPSSMTHWAAFLDEANSANSFLLKAVGGKAAMGFHIEDDDYPRFNYNYLGRPPAVLAEEGAFPTPTITNQAAPVVASTENTTFTLDGFALPLRSLDLNSNAVMELRSLINPVDYIAYRNDSWSGNIVAEVPGLTSKDYFAKVRPGTTMALQIIHGTVAGNIVQIDAPAVQITGDVTTSEEQGKLMFTMPVTLLPVSGNDELVFTSK